MELKVTYKGKSHSVSLENTATLDELAKSLYDLTGVPTTHQKLVYKGKKPSATLETTLVDAGLTSGLKLMLIGPSENELAKLQSTESEVQRRQAIMAQRAASGPTKVRSTGPGPSSQSSEFIFHRIQPLPHLPKPEEATEMLTRLANDPAIRHVMTKHKFAVGLLTELAPHEHPNLLGLNENGGQSIKLRLRTDRYDGFRAYPEIRRVALHELTHNVWGPHDDNFKSLNSLLNAEVAQFEASSRTGAHTLDSSFSPSSPAYSASTSSYVRPYEPVGGEDEEEQVVTSFVLGGGTHSEGDGGSVEDRRARAREAALRRMQNHGEGGNEGR